MRNLEEKKEFPWEQILQTGIVAILFFTVLGFLIKGREEKNKEGIKMTVDGYQYRLPPYNKFFPVPKKSEHYNTVAKWCKEFCNTGHCPRVWYTSYKLRQGPKGEKFSFVKATRKYWLNYVNYSCNYPARKDMQQKYKSRVGPYF